MKPEELVTNILLGAVGLFMVLTLLGLDASWVPELAGKLIAWLLPGALFAMIAGAVASAVTDAFPPWIPATVTAGIWTLLYWTGRAYFLVTS